MWVNRFWGGGAGILVVSLLSLGLFVSPAGAETEMSKYCQGQVQHTLNQIEAGQDRDQAVERLRILCGAAGVRALGAPAVEVVVVEPPTAKNVRCCKFVIPEVTIDGTPVPDFPVTFDFDGDGEPTEYGSEQEVTEAWCLGGDGNGSPDSHRTSGAGCQTVGHDGEQIPAPASWTIIGLDGDGMPIWAPIR